MNIFYDRMDPYPGKIVVIKSGACSIAFRQMDLAEVVAVSAKAGIDGIEWGGDVHVKPGDCATAREARRLTQDAR